MLELLAQLLDDATRETFLLLLLGGAGVSGLFFGMVGAWFGARSGARRGTRRGFREAGRLVDLELRQQVATLQQHVAELSQAVDVVAVEAERISETQRYTARLLALRARADLARVAEHDAPEVPRAITPSDLARPPRHVTPH